MINRLVSLLGHLKLSDITVSHLQQYRRKRLAPKGELIAIAHEAKRQVVLSSENEQKLLAAH